MRRFWDFVWWFREFADVCGGGFHGLDVGWGVGISGCGLIKMVQTTTFAWEDIANIVPNWQFVCTKKSRIAKKVGFAEKNTLAEKLLGGSL